MKTWQIVAVIIIILGLMCYRVNTSTPRKTQKQACEDAIKHLEEKYGAEHNFEYNWFEVTEGRKNSNILHFYADNMYGERVKGSISVAKSGKDVYRDDFFCCLMDPQFSKWIQGKFQKTFKKTAVTILWIQPQFYGSEVYKDMTVEELFEMEEKLAICAHIYIAYDKKVGTNIIEKEIDDILNEFPSEKITYYYDISLVSEEIYKLLFERKYDVVYKEYVLDRSKIDNVTLFGNYTRNRKMGEEQWEN